VLALIGLSALGLRFVVVDMDLVRGVIGLFLLLFGLRWYVKAVRRYAGRTALHDEAEEFRETREALGHAEVRAAWIIAFKGVLLEGLEVWLLVVAVGHGLGWAPAASAAALALLVVIAAGMALRAPLTAVPENTLKFLVASALLSFGSFWSLAGLLGEARAWPLGDLTLPLLFLVYAAAGRVLGERLRVPARVPVGAEA
ncbi:MAG: High-affinity Fe2+/Pb2+ permease, partial [Betaproteobacteria bacterium]|nr:High-affinity Fe2+/Pb2+ permease [Betaproteobacteria bacterium]